jgi:CBS domain-containing protein
MKKINDLLAAKQDEIWSIAPEQFVFDALKLMAEKEIGALLVISEGETCGIISERDYARKVLLKGRSSRDTPVRDIMTTDVVFTHPDDTVESCMKLMTTRRIRHLPVLDKDQLVGVISIGDLVKAIISEQKETIELLETYIRS